MRIGEFLVAEGLATEEQVQEALERQRKTGGRLGEILQAMGGMRSLDYYMALSRFFKLEFVDLTKLHLDANLLNERDRSFYTSELILPIRHDNEKVVVATADPSEVCFEHIRARWGEKAKIVITAKLDIFLTLQKVFAHNYTNEIIEELFDKDPSKSARLTFSQSQIISASLLIVAFALSLYVSYPTGMIIFNSILTISVTIVLLFKLALSVIGLATPITHKRERITIEEQTLPTYTVLVPMFREKRVTIEHLFRNLQLLDYPAHKLDIKLILEEDDINTIQIVKNLKLPSYFEIVRVPPSEPRTKPKACNYALKFARGEFITIYDAEDQPDPEQLKVAISVFRQGDDRLACVQCALNYYNSRENWLARMFTMEYTFWFDLMLPALSRLELPIPLGGTSNHFRTAFLKEMVAWDPFNVTEDADLGIRMSRLKYRSQAVTCTTYEEANCKLINWIKQRSRWMKGYMQTYLVHMRNPIKLFDDLGFRGFLSFQLFIGGNILSNLTNIVLLVIFIISLTVGYDKAAMFFPSPTLEIAYFNLIFGNLLLILINALAVWRRRMYTLLPLLLTVPLYWLLAGIASYRALLQLFFHPSKWEKTEHGISRKEFTISFVKHHP